MTNNAQSLRLPLGTYSEVGPHPSRGGNPYSDDVRNDVITRWQLGFGLDTPELKALRSVYAYPSMISCKRYIRKWRELGYAQPKMATGNHPMEREILGQALI